MRTLRRRSSSSMRCDAVKVCWAATDSSSWTRVPIPAARPKIKHLSKSPPVSATSIGVIRIDRSTPRSLMRSSKKLKRIFPNATSIRWIPTSAPMNGTASRSACIANLRGTTYSRIISSLHPRIRCRDSVPSSPLWMPRCSKPIPSATASRVQPLFSSISSDA